MATKIKPQQQNGSVRKEQIRLASYLCGEISLDDLQRGLVHRLVLVQLQCFNLVQATALLDLHAQLLGVAQFLSRLHHRTVQRNANIWLAAVYRHHCCDHTHAHLKSLQNQIITLNRTAVTGVCQQRGLNAYGASLTLQPPPQKDQPKLSIPCNL